MPRKAAAEDPAKTKRTPKAKPVEVEEQPKRGRGRPEKYTPEIVDDLLEKFKAYVEENPVPIISEFASQNWIPRQVLYDREDFSTLLKICQEKKESALERGALLGVLNPTMAIFSLKQMGWSDKQQIDMAANMTTQDVTQLSAEERRARIDELNRRRGT